MVRRTWIVAVILASCWIDLDHAHAELVLFNEDFTSLTNGSRLGQNSPWNGNTPITIDTGAGTATLVAEGNFITTNWFGGQPELLDGQTVVMSSELNVSKSTNSNAASAFFFGFRGGAGGGEFHPNDGISHGISYNVFSSGLIKGNTVGNGSNVGSDINISAPDLGLDINGGDFVGDFFRLITQAEVIDVATGLFSVTTRVEDLSGNILGTTGPTNVTDSGVVAAGGKIQFAIRGANSNYDSLMFNNLRASIITSSVPEPASIVLFLMFAGVSMTRRRHK